MPKSLYLIDGMALAYRSHFALIRSPIHTSKGFNTSAIFGFTAAIIELIAKQRPTHLAIVFDTDAPTERHRIHPEYKAHRDAMPENLAAALPHLSRVAEAFDIPVIEMDGYEADDIIGTLARQAESADFEVYMVTPDKDFGQLVTERVKMYRPSRKGDTPEILGVEEVKEKWGIQRVDQVIDMLGLCGDASDNIPGVAGVGPKTAEKLLAAYGTVENLLEHTAELKGKLRERMETGREQALLSKRLATIDRNVPVEVEWATLEVNPPAKEKILPLFAEFEFRTLAKRIFGDESLPQEEIEFRLESDDPPTKAPAASAVQGELLTLPELKTLADLQADYQIAETLKAVQAMVAELADLDGFAFDTETTALNPHRARLAGIAFARLDRRKGWFVPIPERGNEPIVQSLEPLLNNPKHLKVGHNLKFDLTILIHAGIPVCGPYFDTLIAHSLVSPAQRHSLDRLAEELLEYQTIPFEAVFANASSADKASIDYSVVDKTMLKDYAVEDADVAGRLKARLEPEIEKFGQSKIFTEIESQLIPVLARMELTGIRLNPETLHGIGRDLSGKISALEARCYDYAGREFNLNSPKQLGEILFDGLKILDRPKKTKTGQYATNEQVLSQLTSHHPIVPAILEHRGLVKLKNTYVDTLPDAIEPSSGRIHTHYGQVQTTTGRLSSNNPNLQNIPVRSGEGREIRRAFIPESGWLMISADYSQIELRILAAISQDGGLLDAFARGMDIHSATAARIYGVAVDAVTREMRSKAKMVNFGIPYGISAFGLAQRLGCSRSEASDLISNYFSQFPKVRHYNESTIEFAKENGYVETLSGRRRYLEDIRSANATIRASAERNAINMPIQGTAADMIKLAMIRVDERLQKSSLRARLLLQVHDELILECPKEEQSRVEHIVIDAMENALPIACPVKVEIGHGENWLEAH